MRATQKLEIIKLGKRVAELKQTYENPNPIPKLHRVTTDTLYTIAHYLGITVFAISFTAFLGHILNFLGMDEWWFYRWYYKDVGMAFNTSIVIMIISATMLALAILVKRNEKKP